MATTGERSDEHAEFWEVAEPFLASGRLVEGTMMGHQCLRTAAGNGFVATVERSSATRAPTSSWDAPDSTSVWKAWASSMGLRS